MQYIKPFDKSLKIKTKPGKPGQGINPIKIPVNRKYERGNKNERTHNQNKRTPGFSEQRT